jgi:tetratricopeptide (TPR) repeat protein
LEICGFTVTQEQLTDFLQNGLLHLVLVPSKLEGEYIPFFMVETNTKRYIGLKHTNEEIKQMHTYADRFYRTIFISILKAIYELEDLNLEEDATQEDLVNLVIRPGGFIDYGAHYPEAPSFHSWSLSRAFYWQHHLFCLGKFEEAADITNSICFALERRGYKRIVKEMLARNIEATTGLHKAVARINLATVLRQEMEHDAAMRIYVRSLFPLVIHRGYFQLAGVLSEMSNIHRDKGQLIRALLIQHSSSILRFFLKDVKGRAICHNQLSILYRTLRLYRLALYYSRSAESYWRCVLDEVNLAKTLLTQGNLYNHMKQPGVALERFEESLEINIRIENYSEAASSLSGKARAYMQLREYAQAHHLLEEAISLRQRYSDRRIGIEYENMGQLNELQGKLYQAVGWYRKALPQLEKYQPGFARGCRRKITLIEKRL